MQIRCRLFLSALAALVSALVVSPAVPAETAQNNHQPQPVNEVSGKQRATDFSLSGLDGKTYNLANCLDSVPAVVWFTNLCPGCQANIPALDSIYRTEMKPQAELLAISLPGTNDTTVEDVSRQLGFAFPILIDSGGTACADYVGEYTPGTCPAVNMFVVDRDGTIRLETHFPGAPLTELLSLLKELDRPHERIRDTKNAGSGG